MRSVDGAQRISYHGRMTESTGEIIAGLWENGRDSITHALDHFSEREAERSNRRHHDKWIVLSVHHAAECVCNMRLLGLDPSCPLFLRKGELWFPSLSSPAEDQLFLMLNKLPNIRHQFMHRTAPKELDVSIAAMCMIGIFKHVERLKGESASDIIWPSPPTKGDVVAAIRYTSLEEYNEFVARFLEEKYPNNRLPHCPSCAARAVVYGTCEACFATELESIKCSGCDEEIYFEAWERKHGDRVVECDCGLKHAYSRGPPRHQARSGSVSYQFEIQGGKIFQSLWTAACAQRIPIIP